jgi:hypothetical protein
MHMRQHLVLQGIEEGQAPYLANDRLREMVRGAALVSRNVSNFTHAPVEVLNPRETRRPHHHQDLATPALLVLGCSGHLGAREAYLK